MKKVQHEKSVTWKKSKHSSIQISIGRVLAKYWSNKVQVLTEYSTDVSRRVYVCSGKLLKYCRLLMSCIILF